MTVPAGFKTVRWALLAVIVLGPLALLAQQDEAARRQNPQSQDQPAAQAETATADAAGEAGEAKTEAPESKAETTPEQAEAATAKTEEKQEHTEAATAEKGTDAKVISGMSILGNQEAPKSLVIVPWKSSELGAAAGISTVLDDSRQPVDKEVFMRALRYYEIRSETKP